MNFKRSALMMLALAAVSLVSCTQDEEVLNVQENEEVTEDGNYKVLEENVVNGSELFAGAMEGMEQFEGLEAYKDLKEAFEKADLNNTDS